MGYVIFKNYIAHLNFFMDYNKLVAVTGLSGLFELVSSKADGGIVRSLDDKSTKFVSNRVHTFSHLESIEVFTTTDNVNLSELFIAMKNSKEKLPDANNAKDVKSYFQKVYSNMDFERVYGSDMKKMIKWMEILNNNNIEIKLSDASGEDAVTEQAVEKKTTTAGKGGAPKTAAVKSAPPKKINTPRKMA